MENFSISTEKAIEILEQSDGILVADENGQFVKKEKSEYINVIKRGELIMYIEDGFVNMMEVLLKDGNKVVILLK